MESLASAVPIFGTMGILLSAWFLKQTLDDFRTVMRLVNAHQSQLQDHAKRLTKNEILLTDMAKFLSEELGFKIKERDSL